MSELEALRTFYRYNSRVRRNYLEALLRLTPQERLKDRGASYPSLQEIFVHTLDGLRFWLYYVPRDRVAEATNLPARDLTEQTLRTAVEETDRLVFDYVAFLTEADLSKEMVCHFPADGSTTEARFPVGDVLWHEVEEELQHRGELNAILWQMDIDPPIAQAEDWNASKNG